jgi:hypothetical protein
MAITYTRFSNNGSWLLPPNQQMVANNYLTSKNGRYTLTVQPDGNLTLSEGPNVIWVANQQQPYSKTIRQKNLTFVNFVVSNSGFLYDPFHRRLWIAVSTHTTDKSYWRHSYLAVQDDGNIVILDMRRRWSSRPDLQFNPAGDSTAILANGEQLGLDHIQTAGQYALHFTGDGDLVVKTPDGNVVWRAGTAGRGAQKATMRSDGNFVIEAGNGAVIWQTGTARHPGAHLTLRNDGQLEVISESPRWARFGFQPGRFPRPRRFKSFHPSYEAGSIYTWRW